MMFKGLLILGMVGSRDGLYQFLGWLVPDLTAYRDGQF